MDTFLQHVLNTYRGKNESCMSLQFNCMQSFFEIIAEVMGQKLSRILWKRDDLPVIRNKEDKKKMFQLNSKKHAHVTILVDECEQCVEKRTEEIDLEKHLVIKVLIHNMSNYINIINVDDIVELKLHISLKSIRGLGFCFSIDKGYLVEYTRDSTTQRLVRNLTKAGMFWGPYLAIGRTWIGKKYNQDGSSEQHGTHQVTGLLHYALEEVLEYEVINAGDGKVWYSLTNYGSFD